jgi:transcriptional regulator with XRE-family HTH domain
MPTKKTPRERLDEAALRAAMEGRSVLEVSHATELGENLREWRTAKGMSLRAAAEELGIAFSILQKMETGGRVRTPDVDFLEKVALVYGVSTPDVFQAAGYSLREVSDVRDAIDAAFRALVLDPRLCPRGMDPGWLDAFSTKQKRQWLEFAWRLQSLLDSEQGERLPVDPDVVHLFAPEGEEGSR